jgi:hypothetical protein
MIDYVRITTTIQNHSHGIAFATANILTFPRAYDSHRRKLEQKLLISLKPNLGQHILQLLLQLNPLLVQIIHLLLQQFILFQRTSMFLQ